jgi:hypothetical protein
MIGGMVNAVEKETWWNRIIQTPKIRLEIDEGMLREWNGNNEECSRVVLVDDKTTDTLFFLANFVNTS